MLKLRKNSRPNPPHFSWKEHASGIRFAPEPAALSLVDYVENLPIDAYHAQAQWLLLQELIDNGQAEASDADVLVPYIAICVLNSEDCQRLGLPEPYPFDLSIRSHGTLNQLGFRYDYQFQEPDRKPLYPKRTGCILRFTEERSYVLSREQYVLLEKLDAFNDQVLERKSFQANLLEFARIKGLARQTGSELDRYLNQEDVVTPRTIRLRLRESNDGVDIIPEVDGVDNDSFAEVFSKFPNPEKTYSLSGDQGERTRVVFQEQQQEALRTIKKHQRVTQEELDEIAAHPQDYFDPDVVELDPVGAVPSFSERVLKVGIYRPKLYPFVSPYKSEWIPGVIVEDEFGARSRFTVKTKEELEELKHVVQHAKASGQEHMTWQNQQVPVAEVERHIPFIEEQLKHREKPSRGSEDEPETEVLIIEENIEEPDYVEGTLDAPLEEPFRHLLEYPPNLKPDLKLLRHQEEGLAWLQQLWKQKYPGGLLADDMGLGKTLQVLSFLEWHCHRGGSQGPFLIIAPIALLENWQSEYPKFFDRGVLGFVTLYGEALQDYKRKAFSLGDSETPEIDGVEGLMQRRRRGALDIERLSKSNLVLTTYETVRDFQLDLGQIDWAVVVIDEAQRVKTPGTLVTNAIKALKTHFRIALTGTPVENSLMDLWCITDFVAPGLLDSAVEFDRRFCKSLKHVKQTEVRALGEEIRVQIGVHFKRRLKNDILEDLPEKHVHDDEDYRREMPPQQIERYQAALRLTLENDSSEQRPPNQVLQTIRRLKDISDHPLLVDSKIAEVETPELIKQSAKLTVTIQILENIRSKREKAILFSERRATQRLLYRVIREYFNMTEIHIVTGETPGTVQRVNSVKMSRQQAVDRFQSKSGFNVIIMSPLAAGFGLNITEANHVIHYSRWWNPAKEDQASDRVYRIGQTRSVHVYCPMAVHPHYPTFDLVLHRLLAEKRRLSQGTLFPTEQAEVTSQEVLRDLQKTEAECASMIPVTIEDVDQLEPMHFEVFVAALFDVQGCRSELTPRSGDKGADVVVFSKPQETIGILIQVKQCEAGGKSGPDAVQEIVAAKRPYEDRYGEVFQPAVVTNRAFTKQARQLAQKNRVQLRDRKWLIQTLGRNPVTRTDIDRCSLRSPTSLD